MGAILLAERDETLRRRLHALLLSRGFEVIESGDATSILRALRQKRQLDLFITNTSLATVGDLTTQDVGVRAFHHSSCSLVGFSHPVGEPKKRDKNFILGRG